jgi:hypothetical protein
MASEVFDLFLQIGKAREPGLAVQIPDLKETHLKNITPQKHFFNINNTVIRVYSSNTLNKSFCDAGNLTVILIGRCFPTLAFTSYSSYKSELSATDIAAIYTENQSSLAKLIKGVFILVIYNKNSDSLFAMSSKSGLLKLYYHYTRDTLLLSTTLDTIARHPLFRLELNTVAIIEQLKFGYPLGDYTLFREISILDNHSWLYFDNKKSKLTINKYYNLSDQLSEITQLTWDETYSQTPKIFNSITNMYFSGSEPVNSALTSGFDSRTVLSASLKHKQKIQYFSYGTKPESDDVRIPRVVAHKLGLNYKWIEFRPDFFADYDYYANQLLYFSDGNGNLKRCNQMYSQSVLAENSNLCITGCMGSELLRPNNMMSTNILPNMAKLIYRDKLDSERVSEVMEYCPELLQKDMFTKNKQETTEHIFDSLKSIMTYDKAYLNLYHYSIRYSFWKFFGQEFHASRIYSDLLSPFIDDDFVEFILKTPVPTLNINAFKRNAADLRRGQLFYIPILKKNCPELMDIETGRGYSPGQLESSLFPMNVIIPFSVRRMRNAVFHKKTAFDSTEWNKISYRAHPEVFSKSNDYFRELYSDNIKDSDYSLKKWVIDYL